MILIDAHVHSRYSEHPSEWFLQRLGAAESYTEPETIYRRALALGMTHVTITDHNSVEGVMRLKAKFPDRVVTGVESTAYFPEDGCKGHILIYGLNEREFVHIQSLRTNIYALRDYLIEKNLAHSVAHATYSVNNRLTVSHIEKLVLLFNVFEVINGGRARRNNDLLLNVLFSLGPEKIAELQRRHRIEPAGSEPWVKGFTGGSDDHGGLFIAQTYTHAEACGGDGFLDALRRRATSAHGRHNDFQGLAFSIYKIAYDFAKTRLGNLPRSLTGLIAEQLAPENPARTALPWRQRLKMRYLVWRRVDRRTDVQGRVLMLLNTLKDHADSPTQLKLDLLFDTLAEVCDEYFRSLVRGLAALFRSGRSPDLVSNLGSWLAGAFACMPFFSTLQHLHRDQEMLGELAARFGLPGSNRRRHVLWFVEPEDLGDRNFVLGAQRRAEEKGESVEWITCLAPQNTAAQSVRMLETVRWDGGQEVFEGRFRLPSVLKSLKTLLALDPDEIRVSTSGPVGLLGLGLARLIRIRAVAVKTARFEHAWQGLTSGETLVELAETYLAWFENAFDEKMGSVCDTPAAKIPAAGATR